MKHLIVTKRMAIQETKWRSCLKATWKKEVVVERIVSWAYVRPPQAGCADSPMDSAQTVSYPRVYVGTWVSQKWLSEHRWTRVRSPVARTPTTGINGEGHGDKSFIVLEGTVEDSEGRHTQGCRLRFCSSYLNALKIMRRSRPRNQRLYLLRNFRW